MLRFTHALLVIVPLAAACARSSHLPRHPSTSASTQQTHQQPGPPAQTKSSDSSVSTTRPVEPPAKPLPRAVLPDFHTTFSKLNRTRFVSTGHAAGRYSADVYANPLARESYANQLENAHVGAQIIIEHFERSGDHESPGPIMMMEKRPRGFDAEHGDWRYVVVNSRGELYKDGAIDGCSGCHDDAPRDHLFLLPAP